MNKDYQMALSEVWCIINQYDSETQNKIPRKFKEFIEENRDKTYDPKFNINVHLKDLKLKNETKGILALIYRNYLCAKEKKQEFDNLLKENDKKMQEYLKEKYDVNKIFELRKGTTINKEENTEANNSNYLIDYNKLPWYKKIINKIKRILLKQK